MRIGLLGTGLLGAAISRGLLSRGHQLIVWNRSRGKAEALVEFGATLANSPSEVIAQSEWSLLVLKDSYATEAVLFELAGEAALANARLLQMATVSPEQSRSMAQRVEAAGGAMLELPVLGSTPQAETGQLIVMIAGPKPLATQAEPLLADLGEQRHYLGEYGKAAALKLALNHLLVAEVAALSLSLGIVSRAGLDSERFMQIVRSSSLHAPQLDKKLPGMLARDFTDPHFPVTHMLKDVNLVLAEADRLGLHADTAVGLRRVLERTIEAGYGDLDYSALHNGIDPPDAD